MVTVTMLSPQSQNEKAERLARKTMAALCRKNLPHEEMTILEASEDGQSTRRKVQCDFTKAANLALFDKHIIPYITEFLVEVEKKNRTGISAHFSKEALYAIQELKSVSKMDIDQISAVLYPKPKVELGQVLSFPFGRS
jgi:hypothetical protein